MLTLASMSDSNSEGRCAQCGAELAAEAEGPPPAGATCEACREDKTGLVERPAESEAFAAEDKTGLIERDEPTNLALPVAPAFEDEGVTQLETVRPTEDPKPAE